MEKEKIFYGSLSGGNCFLIKAIDEDVARVKAKDIFGRINEPQILRKATEQDIAWVKAMNGIIH